MNKENYEVVVFNDNDLSLEVKVDSNKETVWLTQEEMAKLFNVNRTRITRHIHNIYDEKELEEKLTSAENALVQIEGKRNVRRNVKLYNLWKFRRNNRCYLSKCFWSRCL